jgi:hypothetical protein
MTQQVFGNSLAPPGVATGRESSFAKRNVPLQYAQVQTIKPSRESQYRRTAASMYSNAGVRKIEEEEKDESGYNF